MFKILGIDHLVFRVRDLARVEAFYREALGCEVVKRQERLGLVHLRAGRALVDLIAADGELGRMGGAAPGPEGHNVAHLCLQVEPFDGPALRAHFQTLGVPVTDVSENYGAEGYGPSLYLTDPEGNTVELKAPGPPSDSGPSR